MSLPALVLLLLPVAAAAPVGTHTTASWDAWVTGPDGRTVWYAIHYPAVSSAYGADADPSAGPFPLAVLVHGYLGQAWMYATAAEALASKGMVVLLPDTETGPVLDPAALAADAQVLLQWADARSAEPTHWLAGMAAPGPWTAMGHSMGGIAIAHLADREPRVEALVGFAPYRDDDHLWDAYTTFGGHAFLIGGDEDETSTPAIVGGWLDDMDAPATGLLGVIRGAGHQAITDLAFESHTLDEDTQLALNLDLAGHLLDAAATGDRQALHPALCGFAPGFNPLASRSAAPVLTVAADAPDRLTLGLAAFPGDTLALYAGAGPGRSTTPDGVLGLADAVPLARVALPTGADCVTLDLDPALAGVAFVQGVVADDGPLRTTEIRDVFGTGGGSGAGGDDGGTGGGDDGSTGGGDDGGDDGSAGADDGPGGGDGSGGDDAAADTGPRPLGDGKTGPSGGCNAAPGATLAALGAALALTASRARRSR